MLRVGYVRVLLRAAPLTVKPSISFARLRELLHYDPTSGIFIRIKYGRGEGGFYGKVAGTVVSRKGCFYLVINVDYKLYYAHRLAFFWMTGIWPSEKIDHRDGDGTNNRWKNLRDKSQRVNCENKRHARKGNVSRLLGVSRTTDGKAWRARIGVGYKSIYLGRFSSKRKAHHAYVVAKRKLHEGCTI